MLIRHLGRSEYVAVWEAMRAFTAARGSDTADEIWITEHFPVYTLGQAGRIGHFLADRADRANRANRANRAIPLIKTDRGGQITYHGPGQVVAYPLLDLTRRRYKARALVTLLEEAVIDFLRDHLPSGMPAPRRRPGAPGIYIDLEREGENGVETVEAKIAALGLRIRNGCCYHGLALNVDMDLAPFAAIDPCGYAGMAVTQTRALGIALSADDVAALLPAYLCRYLESVE